VKLEENGLLRAVTIGLQPRNFSSLSTKKWEFHEVNKYENNLIEQANESAIEVLPHNMHGPCWGLPRTV